MNEQREEMTEFEEQLARAVRRVDAPMGFAERLMERAGATPSLVAAPTRVSEATRSAALRAGPAAPKVVVMPLRTRFWMSGAAAAALLAGAFIAGEVHQRREQARVEQQYAEAMRVTNHALDQTRERLAKAGITLNQI